MRSPHETHGITPISHQIHVPHTITTTCYPHHSILMQVLHQPKQNPCVTHANIPNFNAYKSRNHTYSWHIANPWINYRKHNQVCTPLA